MSALLGKTAIVTGAGSGIGRGAAIRLAADGAAVFCADLDGARASETADLITKAAGQAAASQVDVTDQRSTEQMAAACIDRFAGIDVLFANAGVTGSGSAMTTEMDEWYRVLSVNLTGVWLSMRAVLPHMTSARSGSIVSTCSISAVRGYPGNTPYAVSKGGVLALTRQAAVEYAPMGVRVNAVAPGAVLTQLSRDNFDLRGGMAGVDGGDFNTVMGAVAARHPLGRLGTPEDIAALVSFLASDDASWITGSIYPIDGGLSST